jgi:hypothetical protein
MSDPTIPGGVIVLIIGAIAAAVVAVIKALGENKKVIQTEITPKLERIEILVDGRYSEVLQELADLKAVIADKSGTMVDRQLAKAAQIKADDQQARVTAAPKVENNK